MIRSKVVFWWVAGVLLIRHFSTSVYADSLMVIIYYTLGTLRVVIGWMVGSDALLLVSTR